MSKSQKELLLGYYFNGPDNDSYMNTDQYEVNICDCIDYVKNRHLHIQSDFKLRKKQYDLSTTYDGYRIVSDRFKDFIEQGNYSGVTFHPLSKYPTKFFMDIQNEVTFDTDRYGTRFLEYNKECGEYNEVVGANPVILKENIILEDGFYRTDVEFGRSYAKHPLFLAGIITGEKLKKEKFKGLYLEKILSKYKWEASAE